MLGASLAAARATPSRLESQRSGKLEAGTKLGLTPFQRVAILLDPWLFAGVFAFVILGPRSRRKD